MKKYTGTFFRSNPQLKSGGYETERTVEAKTEKSAIKKFNDICNGCLYGGMTFIGIKSVEAI